MWENFLSARKWKIQIYLEKVCAKCTVDYHSLPLYSYYYLLLDSTNGVFYIISNTFNKLWFYAIEEKK